MPCWNFTHSRGTEKKIVGWARLFTRWISNELRTISPSRKNGLEPRGRNRLASNGVRRTKLAVSTEEANRNARP